MGFELMWMILLVCAVACAVGFKKFVYFLSIGYGFAVAAGAVATGIIFWDRLNWVTVLLIVLFVAYGARLSGFLLVRELKSASYRKTLGEVTKTENPMPIFVLATIWVCVSLLYTAQVSPVFYRLYNGSADVVVPLIGAAISVAGLVLESLADKQKSEQKKNNPDMVATQGLYKLVRCPNYLGEIIFWTGVLVSAFTTLSGVGQWMMAIVAWVLIVFIMCNGAQRLEKRQMARYGSDKAYNDYANKTPIIFPFVPLYHLNKQK
ncbi:MAG: DUF1295 domain-containing protein [Clostridia bacterium]|nr:DUF1295 domain-containing protein [Clostridia bacterium]